MAYLVFRTTYVDPANPTDAERVRTLMFSETGFGPRSMLRPLNPDYAGPKGLMGGLYVGAPIATVILDTEFANTSPSIRNQIADMMDQSPALLTVTSVAATYPAAGTATNLTSAQVRTYPA